MSFGLRRIRTPRKENCAERAQPRERRIQNIIRYQQLCTQRHVAQAAEEEMNPSLATRWNNQRGPRREP